MSYAPHETLIAPARTSMGLRRLITGCVVFVVIFYLMALGISTLQTALLSPYERGTLDRELVTASTVRGALINLFSFGLLIVALWITLRLVHRRTLRSLIGSRATTWLSFRKVVIATVILFAVLYFLPVPEEFRPSQAKSLDRWLIWLAPAMIALLIQVSAEELVFRGYLQSQLAARFRTPVIWMGIPSILFALLHYGNAGEGGYAWLIVVWAGCFGLAAADLTARTGTLGPAIALHFVNNFSALILAAPEGHFDGLALYTLPISVMDNDLVAAWMPVEMMVLLCAWLAARLALRV